MTNIIFAVIFLGFALHDVHVFFTSGSEIKLLYCIRNLFLGYFFFRQKEATNASRNFFEWLIAFMGTTHFLFFSNVGILSIFAFKLGAILICLGVGLSIISIVSLGTSISIVPTNRGIKTNDFYRYVRHPLYASYMVVNFGTVLAYPTLFNVCLFIFGAWLIYKRAILEENLLMSDPQYMDYCSRVKARFVPGVF